MKTSSELVEFASPLALPTGGDVYATTISSAVSQSAWIPTIDVIRDFLGAVGGQILVWHSNQFNVPKMGPYVSVEAIFVTSQPISTPRKWYEIAGGYPGIRLDSTPFSHAELRKLSRVRRPCVFNELSKLEETPSDDPHLVVHRAFMAALSRARESFQACPYAGFEAVWELCFPDKPPHGFEAPTYMSLPPHVVDALRAAPLNGFDPTERDLRLRLYATMEDPWEAAEAARAIVHD